MYCHCIGALYCCIQKMLIFDHFRSEFQFFSLQRPPLMSGSGSISLSFRSEFEKSQSFYVLRKWFWYQNNQHEFDFSKKPRFLASRSPFPAGSEKCKKKFPAGNFLAPINTSQDRSHFQSGLVYLRGPWTVPTPLIKLVVFWAGFSARECYVADFPS